VAKKLSEWKVKSKDGTWYIYYKGKPMMKSKKLCRVLKEFRRIEK